MTNWIEWFDETIPALLLGMIGAIVRYLQGEKRGTRHCIAMLTAGLFSTLMISMLCRWKQVPSDLAYFLGGAAGYCSTIFLIWLESQVKEKIGDQISLEKKR